MWNAAATESVLFKRVAGGYYVFQLPSAWIFGPKSRFLVSETQKAQLLTLLTPRRPILRIVAIVAAILFWTIAVSAIMWLGTGRDQPSGSDILVLIVLLLGPMALALMVALRWNRRRMQPILAAAAPTVEKITRSELRQALAKSTSFGQALMIGAIWLMTFLLQTGTLVLRNGRHPIFGDVQSYVTLALAIAAAGLAIHYLRIAIRKKRSTV